MINLSQSQQASRQITLSFIDSGHGGTGKSIVALALIDHLSVPGDVLVIDADPYNPDVSMQLKNTLQPITVLQAELATDDGFSDFMETLEAAVSDAGSKYKDIVVALPTNACIKTDNIKCAKAVLKGLNVAVHQYFIASLASSNVSKFIKSGQDGIGQLADLRILIKNEHFGARDQFKYDGMYFPALSANAMLILRESGINKSFSEIATDSSMPIIHRSNLTRWIARYNELFVTARSSSMVVVDGDQVKLVKRFYADLPQCYVRDNRA